jgi:hypothetical protein
MTSGIMGASIRISTSFNRTSLGRDGGVAVTRYTG